MTCFQVLIRVRHQLLSTPGPRQQVTRPTTPTRNTTLLNLFYISFTCRCSYRNPAESHIEQQSLSNVLLFWNIILSGGDEQMVINNHSSVTCLVMESMSRTKRSCSVRTPGHEPNDIISLSVWGNPVSQNKRTHRYCRAAAACNESHCWSFLPLVPEHNRANWGYIWFWDRRQAGHCCQARLVCASAPPCFISPSLFPQSPHRWCARSLPAVPAGRTAPAQSGRSWTSSGWTAAASQSEREPNPPRWQMDGMTGPRETDTKTISLELKNNSVVTFKWIVSLIRTLVIELNLFI